MINGIGTETITCWTVQHAAVWQSLQETGQYCLSDVAAATYIEPGHSQAYGWLREQMQRRLGILCNYPIWAYARIHPEDYRNEINAWLTPIEKAPKPEPHVLLECRLPVGSVLLVDSDEWHNVLIGWPVHAADASEGAVDAWWDGLEGRLSDEEMQAGTISHSGWPPHIRQEIEATWEAIFDISYWQQHRPHASVEAVFSELRLDQVRRAIPLPRSRIERLRRARVARIVRSLAALATYK